MLRRFAITLLVTALPVVGLAQTSVYSSMTLAGSFQGWNPGANNMTLVSNNTWRATLFAQRGAQEYFKFAANRSWDINWGQSAILSPPVTNVAILTAADIAISFPQDGYYRFTFNDQTLIYSIILDSVSLPWTNRTRNGSFELEGSEETKPLHWENGFPDGMGDLWGNVGRADWRALTGSSIAYIGAGDWDYGGFWQDIPAGRGFTYELTANFWADAEPPYGPWTADNKELKIEFFGSGFSGPLAVYATPLDGLTSDWTEFKVIGEAPEGTMYARSVISVSGAGDLGSLQFDDVSIREIPPMAQSFSWPFAFTPGRYSYAGWLMTTGSVTDEARTGLAASLPQGGQIVSPLTTSGVGRVNFFYRHENTTDPEDNLEPITFRVQTSPNGSSWTTKGTVSNIVAQSYQSYSLYLADPDVRYVRVDHLSGTNNLLIDDIQLADATDDPRLQDFEGAGWTNTSDTIITINDWLLSLGRITTNEAYSGTSGVIGDPLVPTNVFTWQLRSPYYSDGYGTISFQYARGTNGYGPASLRLQESPDGSNTWTDLAVIEPIISGSYIQYNQFFYEPNPRYIRIVNQQIDAGAIDNVLIQEPFTEGSEAPGGWLFDGVGEYTSDSSSGESPNSVKFDTTGDTITTPVLNHPTNLTFWMKGNGISGSSFLIETTTDGSLWNTLVNLTSLSNTESSPSYSLSTNVIQIRFTYTKVSGNLAFDDVYIVGVATGETGPQELLIDDFSISKPVAYRNQNFETWPRKSSYTSGTDEWEGWSVQQTIVDPQNGYEGQVGRMNDDVVSIIQSHVHGDGIGNISFYYQLWPGDSAATVQIQTSTNMGASWTTLDTLVANNDSEYLFYSKYNFITNSTMVRFYKNGGDRIMFDNILIDTPKPPADVVINAEIDPPAPFTNDAVYLDAIVLPANGAETTNVTAYYRIGTSGGFTTLAMTNTGYITYRSATNIPAQPAGTIVQYYFKVEF
ncbi:MAG: hypothetical protein KDL31_12630, partial [Kiritimatiellae bacterium]|nr:hypothetical protein [Kiritimatiellia bacterium]